MPFDGNQVQEVLESETAKLAVKKVVVCRDDRKSIEGLSCRNHERDAVQVARVVGANQERGVRKIVSSGNVDSAPEPAQKARDAFENRLGDLLGT